MKHYVLLIVALVITCLITTTALAQELVIYPAKGQSNDQLEKDKFECYSWAKQQTGFDPMQPPTATAPPPPKQEKGGEVLKGAAGGAIIGGAIGGITSGKVGKGMAYGAGGGALLGGMSKASKRKQDEQNRQQWEKEQSAQYAQMRNNYNRAYSACLEGRGYTVK